MTTETQTFNKWSNQYIGGEWTIGNSENTYVHTNPYDQSKLVDIQLASMGDVDAAYQSAEKVQVDWQSLSAEERANVMKKAAQVTEDMREEIVDVLVREAGSSIMKANTEIDFVIADINQHAGIPLQMEGAEVRSSMVPGKQNKVYRLPVGVVGVISPFNFPLFLSVRAIAPALAAGNGVVVKPDVQTFISGGLIIAKIFEEAGLPKGLLNIAVSDIAEIGDGFVDHPIPQAISFTGSTAAGKHIAKLCAENLKKVSLELGGNNAMIILDDADVSQAASAAVFGNFLHQGQICMSTNRVIVHSDIYDAFVEQFKEKTAALKAGNPADPNTFVGPLINEHQAKKIAAWVDESIEQGANCILRGEISGTSVDPIVLTEVTNDMAVAKNEMFGPVASIIKVDSEAEAIRVANDSDFGLSGSVFTGDLERGEKVALQVQSGMVHVNDQSVNSESNIPFGGVKQSGMGRYGGEWSLDEFTEMRWISVQTEPRPFPF